MLWIVAPTRVGHFERALSGMSGRRERRASAKIETRCEKALSALLTVE
jgi:hypothetical protein